MSNFASTSTTPRTGKSPARWQCRAARVGKLVLLLILGCCPCLSAHPRPADPPDDTILPNSQVVIERLKQALPWRVPGSAEEPAEAVRYKSMQGSMLTMAQYRGRHIALLLTKAADQALPAPARRELLDHLDLLYEHFRDLTGTEPAGDGLLRTAIVPSLGRRRTVGLGFVGAKGIEMLESHFLADIRHSKAGVVHQTLVHEMAHNFDRFSGRMAALPDAAHSFTSLMEILMPIYSKQGLYRITGEDAARAAALEWVARLNHHAPPATSWTRCIDGNCPAAEAAKAEHDWGLMHAEYVRLFGAGALRRSFLCILKQTGGKVVVLQRTQREREQARDLHLRGLAEGADADLGCVWQAWHITVPAAESDRMRARFGGRQPAACSDKDRDGFAPVKGDLDDTRSDVHPRAQVWPRQAVVDVRGTGAPPAREFTGAFRIEGRTGGFRTERIRIAGGAGTRLFRLESHTAHSVVGTVTRGDSGRTLAQFWSDGRHNPTVALDCPQGEPCVVSVTAALGEGGSDFTLDSWPAQTAGAAWGRLGPPLRQGGQLLLTALVNPLDPVVAEARPDKVRFWVSGTGYVCEAAFGAVATCRAPLTEQQFQKGLQGYRAIAFRDGVPVLADTGAQPFALDAGLQLLPYAERLRQLRDRAAKVWTGQPLH